MLKDIISGLLSLPLSILWIIAPMYAAYCDFQKGNFFLALFDYAFFPLGAIRSILFLLGVI
ncbi:hypothetical protein BKG93_10860 [Rodentibacter ratti]|uniref:Uncharacterized protein n=2 Tax=Rodentibacter TaxID=1960084 RepID=A0A1V3KZY4_9PAST|nr:hypothetical protein BKK52_04900 [Rodentibacter trehalosifermentans]OOF82880.1 hypothetical protein BKG93_10860 [Rodentibacter ratti]